MKTSQEIHDMIQEFDLDASPELTTSRILDILDALNRRMDGIEAGRNASIIPQGKREAR